MGHSNPARLTGSKATVGGEGGREGERRLTCNPCVTPCHTCITPVSPCVTPVSRLRRPRPLPRSLPGSACAPSPSSSSRTPVTSAAGLPSSQTPTSRCPWSPRPVSMRGLVRSLLSRANFANLWSTCRACERRDRGHQRRYVPHRRGGGRRRAARLQAQGRQSVSRNRCPAPSPGHLLPRSEV